MTIESKCSLCEQELNPDQGSGYTFQFKGKGIHPGTENWEWIQVTSHIRGKSSDGEGQNIPLCTDCFIGVMSRCFAKAKETPALMSTEMDFLKF